jgi:hypothetical protein
VPLRRRSTHERDGKRVVIRIAALQVGHPGLVMRGSGVVLVDSEPVVVLRMIVIDVGVDVRRRRHAGGRHQRRDEQDAQGAVHGISLWDRRAEGQKQVS